MNGEEYIILCKGTINVANGRYIIKSRQQGDKLVFLFYDTKNYRLDDEYKRVFEKYYLNGIYSKNKDTTKVATAFVEGMLDNAWKHPILTFRLRNVLKSLREKKDISDIFEH